MRPLLRSVWDEPRPPNPPSRVWRDWALVGVVVSAALLEGVVRADLPWRVVAVIVTVGLVPTVLWRRTRPLLVVAVAFGVLGVATLATGGAVPQMYSGGYVLVLPYALFRWGAGREMALGSAIILGKGGLAALAGATAFADSVGGLAVLTCVMAFGAAFRYRAGVRTRELHQVTLLERERLARDLHDTVAHHVSAIAIRAQAGLATAASQPGAATEALQVIEAEASRTLAEMRSMVRILRRDEPAELSPGRRIADLRQLADRARTGPSVDVEIIGDLDDLAPPVGAAIYRLAQESVTNARRHARHATRIVVRVVAAGSSVHLRVRDDGDPNPARPAASSAYGLVGMIERAHLLGGTCEAGPDPDRGWTVTAVLPRAGPAS